MKKQLLIIIASTAVMLTANQVLGQARWSGGDGNWTDANWTGGSGPGGAPGPGNTVTLPGSTGTVNVTTDLVGDVGVFGALTMQGGALNVAATGQIEAQGDQRVNNVLNVSGQFVSQGGLDVLREGGGVGEVYVSGDAELSVGANLDTWWDDGAIFGVTGGDADIEVGGTFFLGTGARMIAEINSSSFSTVNVLGNVNFPGGAGTLEVNFVDGFSPTLGDSWVLFDSPAVGGTIPVLEFPPVEFGERLSVEYGEGGELGQVVTLDFSNTLNLRVNTVSGAVDIGNPVAGASALDIDGYLIRSPDGALVESELTGVGAGWAPGLAPSQSSGLLTETNFDESTVVGQGQSLPLGNIFNTAMSGDLQFEFHLAGGQTIPGTVQYVGGTSGGDYNVDGVVNDADADLQSAAMKEADPDLATFDENGDSVVDAADRGIWVKAHAKTWFGDANLDGEFNSGDFVVVFTAGKYQNGEMAGWAEGDWDGNMLFDSGDFVVAFTDSGYNAGLLPAVAAVPEPSGLVLALLGSVVLVRRRRLA